MSNKQKRLERFLRSLTIYGALMATLFLGLIVFFVFSNGHALINIELLTSDYHTKHYKASLIDDNLDTTTYPYNDTGHPYSPRYGIALKEATDRAGNPVIKVAYLHPDSPLNELQNNNTPHDTLHLLNDHIIQRIAYHDAPTSLTNRGAEAMINDLEAGYAIREISYAALGGGIRGSLITTLYLIGLTLIIALPIGIISAIYLVEFAPKNAITNTLRSFIEMLTGVPSIIYGLIGISIFVPITLRLRLSEGTNLYAAAITLAVILLPVIIRTTEEALKVIPDDYRQASFALGANRSQTVFRIILPNALPGIMTAIFLSIGRIIGESAALIFVLGTAIKDQVSLSQNSTSLAVHIWTVMSNEPANIELASSIALIILLIVFVLNIAIKWFNLRLHKKLKG